MSSVTQAIDDFINATCRNILPRVVRITINGDFTAVEWSDGVERLVRRRGADANDPEKAVMAAMLKRFAPGWQTQVRRAEKVCEYAEKAALDGAGPCPEHYKGDGLTCARAMDSMCAGWERAEVSANAQYWGRCALKYLWRWPLKGQAESDIAKAIDCLDKMKCYMKED